MDLVILVTAFALSVGTTVTLTPVLSVLAVKRGWLDKPDEERKLHLRPIPPMGGLAIFAGVAAGTAYLLALREELSFALPELSPILVLGMIVIVATGFYDDVRGLGFKGKFAIQVAVAYLLLHAGYRIDVSIFPFVGDDPYVQALISIPLTLLWIVGTINAVNLIDGLDGLAAGVALIAFASFAAIFGLNGDLGLVVIATVLIGALLGFLAHNFNPATVFMGDSGSLFLGCALAVYSLSGKADTDPLVALLVPVVALALPLLDTGLSIVRRLMSGGSVFAPDRDHIHHRLSRIWPQWQAVLVLYAVAGIFGLTAVGLAALSPMIGLGVLGITLMGAATGLMMLGYLRLRGRGLAAGPGSGAPDGQRVLAATLAGGDGHGSVVAGDLELLTNVSRADSENVRERLQKDSAPRTHVDAVRRRRLKRQPIPSLYSNDMLDEMIKMLNKKSVVVANAALAAADLGGESVILDSERGRYFGVNAVGARILELIAQPYRVQDLLETVQSEYEVDPDTLEQDVTSFLKSLEKEQLLHVVEEN